MFSDKMTRDREPKDQRAVTLARCIVSGCLVAALIRMSFFLFTSWEYVPYSLLNEFNWVFKFNNTSKYMKVSDALDHFALGAWITVQLVGTILALFGLITSRQKWMLLYYYQSCFELGAFLGAYSSIFIYSYVQTKEEKDFDSGFYLICILIVLIVIAVGILFYYVFIYLVAKAYVILQYENAIDRMVRRAIARCENDRAVREQV